MEDPLNKLNDITNQKFETHVWFEDSKTLNKARSQLVNKPVYDEFEVCKIRSQYDTTLVVPHKATDYVTVGNRRLQYKELYANEYAMFRSFKEAKVKDETPIDEVFTLEDYEIDEIKRSGFATAERVVFSDDATLLAKGNMFLAYKRRLKEFLQRKEVSMEETPSQKEMEKAATDKQTELERVRAQILEAGLDDKEEKPEPSASDYDEMDKDELKAMIKDLSGETPKGNPSRATLIKQLQELDAKTAA